MCNKENQAIVEIFEEHGKREVELRWTSITSATDERVTLYRMKKVRDHTKYAMIKQQFLQKFGAPPMNAHGAHRVLRRMLTAQERSPIYIDSVLLQEQSINTPEVQEILVRLNLDEDRILVATKEIVDEIVGVKHSEFVVSCICAFPVAQELEELEPPFLVFDGVNSAENLGSILRTAAALGTKSVLCSQEAFSNINSRCARVSMGAVFHHRFAVPREGESLADAIGRLKQNGITVYAAETWESGATAEVHPHSSRRWALCLGHEGEGVSQEVLAAADEVVCIPQASEFDSINVGHATAVCIYELSKGNTGVEFRP